MVLGGIIQISKNKECAHCQWQAAPGPPITAGNEPSYLNLCIRSSKFDQINQNFDLLLSNIYFKRPDYPQALHLRILSVPLGFLNISICQVQEIRRNITKRPKIKRRTSPLAAPDNHNQLRKHRRFRSAGLWKRTR